MSGYPQVQPLGGTEPRIQRITSSQSMFCAGLGLFATESEDSAHAVPLLRGVAHFSPNIIQMNLRQDEQWGIFRAFFETLGSFHVSNLKHFWNVFHIHRYQINIPLVVLEVTSCRLELLCSLGKSWNSMMDVSFSRDDTGWQPFKMCCVYDGDTIGTQFR